MFWLSVALAFCLCFSYSIADENNKSSDSSIDKILSLLYEQSERIKVLESTIKLQNIDINNLRNEIVILKRTKNERILNESITITQMRPSIDEMKDSDKEKRLLGDSQPADHTTAFYAYMGTHLSGAGPGHTLIFDRVVTNENSCYRPETGIFTAKSRGTYVFTYSIRCQCHSQSHYEIVRNAVVVGVVSADLQGVCIQTHLPGTVVLVLNAGDEVHVRTHSQSDRHGDIVSDSNGWTSFAGWLTSINVA